MNYANLKKAMAAVGHVVSEGEHWLAADTAAFRDFAHFTLGITHDIAHRVLQFPEHFESVLADLPFIEKASEMPPVETEEEIVADDPPRFQIPAPDANSSDEPKQEAPATEEKPADPAAEQKVEAPVADPVVTDTPAPDAPASETPAPDTADIAPSDALADEAPADKTEPAPDTTAQ